MFANKLKNARNPKSQEAFAAEIGMSRRNYIRLEQGEHLPSREFLSRIAKATGRPESYFLDSEELPAAEDEEDDPQMREAFFLFVDLMSRITDRRLLETVPGNAGRRARIA